MVNKKFEAYKIQREIKRSGVIVKVQRSGVNDFNEPTDENIEVCEVKGLYHEQNSTIQITTGETTQTRNKKIPSLLCMYEDTKEIKMGDVISYGNHTFKITGIVDVQEWNIIADISMEVIDNGTAQGVM